MWCVFSRFSTRIAALDPLRTCFPNVHATFVRWKLGFYTTLRTPSLLQLNPSRRMIGRFWSVCRPGRSQARSALIQFVNPHSHIGAGTQELHASHVESTLLSQVRVAFIGQEVDVWVLGRTRVRLNVGACRFRLCAPCSSHSLLVSSDPSSGKALLLTTSTEVSIAPKLRAKQKSVRAQPDAKGLTKASTSASGESSRSAAPQKAKTSYPARTLRLLPQRHLGRYPTPLPTSSGQSLGFVSYRTLLSLYPDRFPGQKLHGWQVTVRRVSPPVNPDKETSTHTPSIAPTPRVLVPNGDPSSSKGKTPEPTKDELTAVWSPDVPVPDGHIALAGGCDNAEDWDLVRYVDCYFHTRYLT